METDPREVMCLLGGGHEWDIKLKTPRMHAICRKCKKIVFYADAMGEEWEQIFKSALTVK